MKNTIEAAETLIDITDEKGEASSRLGDYTVGFCALKDTRWFKVSSDEFMPYAAKGCIVGIKIGAKAEKPTDVVLVGRDLNQGQLKIVAFAKVKKQNVLGRITGVAWPA